MAALHVMHMLALPYSIANSALTQRHTVLDTSTMPFLYSLLCKRRRSGLCSEAQSRRYR